MKKIEIITLNRIVNYGSVLQTFALQKKIEDLGYEAEVIDYFPERMTMMGMLKRIKGKNKILKKPLFYTIARILMIPSYIKRFSIFNKFNKKYINLTNIQYHTDDDFINHPLDADAFCTGSDQTWNSDWNEGITLPFYLNFTEKYKFSYAASFGKSKISEEEGIQIKDYLNKYSKLSVRESSGVEILSNLGLYSYHVLDPTLILGRDKWSALASTKYERKKYILMYNLNRNTRLREYAEKISKKNNLKLIYITYNFIDVFHKGKMACNISVEDFVSLIKNASLVLTDSFHATAFSLIFKRNFYIVYPQKFSTRLQSILQLTHLENRVANTMDEIDLNNTINYEEVDELLLPEVELSIDYLQTSLKGIK